MKGLKQLGAMALAAALAITLAAPISVNAEIIENYDADGNLVSYTNEDTGKTSKHEKEVITEDKAFTIATNSYNETKFFKTTKDVAKFTNFKSNKKALKVKVIDSTEYTDPDKKTIVPDWTEDGKYYYKNVNGEITSVDALSKLPTGRDFGSYTVRFYAKKAGKYKLTYNAVLKDGTTVKKTLKIYAKADGEAIKSITFAGKDIANSNDGDKASTNLLWEKNYGYFTTTAKSGKFRVNMNKDFKLKKIEVGTLNFVEKTSDTDPIKSYEDAPYSSSLDRYTDEYGNSYTMKWKKVKNGKKIKLNKDDYSKIHNYYKNTTYVDKYTTSITYVRITYYDKKNKETSRRVVKIWRVNK